MARADMANKRMRRRGIRCESCLFAKLLCSKFGRFFGLPVPLMEEFVCPLPQGGIP
jgi:hypothetical protein